MRDSLDNLILVIDWVSAANLPQPFEHTHEDNVVVFPDRVELRQCQQLELGMSKYIIHTEVFPSHEKIDADRFLDAFKRAYKLDTLDIRQAIRWALKSSFAPPSVV